MGSAVPVDLLVAVVVLPVLAVTVGLRASKNQETGLRPWVAITAVDLAELLAERGGEDVPPRVEAALGEAQGIAAEIGMQGVLDRVATQTR